MSSAEWFLTDGGGNPDWVLSDVNTPAVAPGVPGSVVATPTGGTTLTIDWTIGSGGSPDQFDVELESPSGSGNWVSAVGAANPVAGGTLTFPASGLTVVTGYTPRVRAKKTGFIDSNWTVGAAVFTDNSGSGGAVIGATDATAPLLGGSIGITALTPTSYTATSPAGSDAVGVTRYQWRIGGAGLWNDIPSGGRVTTITGRTPATTDSLEMRAGDAAGNFSVPLSTAVTLAGVAPTVLTQPSNTSVAEGSTATFSVLFAGSPAPALQWYKNGALIVGATNASYSFTAVAGDTGSVFVCRANNGVGAEVPSNAAVLTVTSVAVAPSIITQPASQAITEGNPCTFSVVATGTAPLSYQWKKNGVNIPGATSSSYTFTPVLADAGAAYSVVVGNSVNAVTSANATLSVFAVGGTDPFARVHTIYFPDTSSPRDVLRLQRSRGDSFSDEFVVKSSVTDQPIDLTGCAFLLTVDPDAAPLDDTNNIFQLVGVVSDAVNGRIGFAPSPVQADLVGSFYFDIQITDPAGRKRTLKYGEYSLRQDITK